MFARGSLFAAVLALLAPASMSHSAVVDSFENGWVKSTGEATDRNTNILTGRFNGAEYRSYFLFDLTSFQGTTIASAKLTFKGGNGVYQTAGAISTGTVFDVKAGSVAGLDEGRAGLQGYDDLGTGEAYATFTLSQSGRSRMPDLALMLNANAIADLQGAVDARAESFGFGVAMTQSDAARSYFWGGSRGASAASLSVGFAPQVVPLPASGVLLALAVAGLGLMRRGTSA